MNARMHGRDSAPGKSNLIHDTFGVLPGKQTVPGKQTLAMGLESQTPAVPVLSASRSPSRASADAVGVEDGINLPGGGGLVDKQSGDPAEVAGGAAATLGSAKAAVGEILSEEASSSDGGDMEGGGSDDVGDGGDEAELARDESGPMQSQDVSGMASGAPSIRDTLRDQVGGGSGSGGGTGGSTSGGGTGGGAGGSVGVATFSMINYRTTPAGVGQRIPPRKNVAVRITFTGLAPKTKAVLSFDGAGSGGNGTIDGRATKTMSKSGNATLRGTTQTSSGSAGTLSLVAKVGTTEIGRSNTFTICAIPTKVSVRFGGLITGTDRGIKMTTFNDSDSGKISDLDQVQMSELVQYQNGTGCFAGITSGNNSGYLPANVSPHGTDSHGTPVTLVTGAGYIESVQGFKFKDARSGATDIGVAHSGFMITRTATASGTRIYLTTHKYPAATAAGGIAVAAGSGSAKRRQRV